MLRAAHPSASSGLLQSKKNKASVLLSISLYLVRRLKFQGLLGEGPLPPSPSPELAEVARGLQRAQLPPPLPQLSLPRLDSLTPTSLGSTPWSCESALHPAPRASLDLKNSEKEYPTPLEPAYEVTHNCLKDCTGAHCYRQEGNSVLISGRLPPHHLLLCLDPWSWVRGRGPPESQVTLLWLALDIPRRIAMWKRR
ncbi:Protocadherin Fat 3 [Manis javanica]|nr:Protocadherin Fat 3 [Manis javanica]